jgi:hypothetical protein
VLRRQEIAVDRPASEKSCLSTPYGAISELWSFAISMSQRASREDFSCWRRCRWGPKLSGCEPFQPKTARSIPISNASWPSAWVIDVYQLIWTLYLIA